MLYIGLPTVKMPMAGLGSWQSAPGEVEKSIEWALESGVRLIDTAYIYTNEKEIGTVLKQWLDSGKIERKDLFVVTKLPFVAMRPELVRDYFDESLKSLGLDYIDLYLIHCPIGVQRDEKTKLIKFFDGKVKFEHDTDLIALWKEMEKLVDAGVARSIGVSNFTSEQLERISNIARIPIAVNQVECHAYFMQKKLRETMNKLGIKMMSYGSLGSPGRDTRPGETPPPQLLADPVVCSIAKTHKKSPAQVLLRHLIQHNIIVIPKSIKQHRIKENFDVFDFELSREDMAKLDQLDKGSAARSFNMGFLPTDEDVTKLKEFPRIPRDEY